MTNGSSTQYYLARRYFQMSPQEWDATPWWESTLLMRGLEDQGIIGDKNSTRPRGDSSGKMSQEAVVDYASEMPLPPGFTQTRRAG